MKKINPFRAKKSKMAVRFEKKIIEKYLIQHFTLHVKAGGWRALQVESVFIDLAYRRSFSCDI